MKINTTTKRIGAAFLGLALCASFAAVAVQKASANEGNGKDNRMMNVGAKIDTKMGDRMKEAGMQPQVMISANGKVLVRGAKVTAISGNAISAEVLWGSYASKWTVDASNAKFLRHFGGNSAVNEITVGDTISFSGSLDTSSANAAVKADVVKDWSVDRTDVDHFGTLQGELKAISSTSTPTDLTVKVKDTDYTVKVSASTSVLNKDWARISLDSFKTGDTIRFYGAINGTTSDATVIRNVSR